jgi:anti-sigma factor RsiW
VPAGSRAGNRLPGGHASGRRRFEAHLGGCPHCGEYLAQVRKTIELTRSLAPDDLTPQMHDEFIAIYRHWRAGQDS